MLQWVTVDALPRDRSRPLVVHLVHVLVYRLVEHGPVDVEVGHLRSHDEEGQVGEDLGEAGEDGHVRPGAVDEDVEVGDVEDDEVVEEGHAAEAVELGHVQGVVGGLLDLNLD